MIKDVNSAYKLTMNVIDSLQKEGIETLIQQPRVIRESETPEELDVVKKYNNPDRIHYSDWRNVQFKVKSQLEAKKVSFARRYLGINGFRLILGLDAAVWIGRLIGRLNLQVLTKIKNEKILIL